MGWLLIPLPLAVLIAFCYFAAPAAAFLLEWFVGPVLILALLWTGFRKLVAIAHGQNAKESSDRASP